MTALRRLGEIDREAAGGFEGEIREFIRRDVSLRRTRPAPAADCGVENVAALIERVSAASVEEIDRLIAELQTLRGTLQSEGDRVRRELTGYAGFSQSALASIRSISETLAGFRPQAFPHAGAG